MNLPRLAAAVVLAAASLAAAAPAYAAATQKDHIEVRHYAPDSGYDPDLLIRCGDQGFVIREGHTSREFRHVWMHPDCEGVTGVYVRSGTELWSKSGGVWRKRFDATGWHYLARGWSDGDGLTVRRD